MKIWVLSEVNKVKYKYKCKTSLDNNTSFFFPRDHASFKRVKEAILHHHFVRTQRKILGEVRSTSNGLQG